jgi:hypothetical protein
MSTTPETTTLDALIDLLRATPRGELPVDMIDCILRQVRTLAGEAPRWISLAEATALYGARSEQFLHGWADFGWLQSRVAPDGSLELRLDEILYKRAEYEGLAGFGPSDDPLSEEELRIMRESTPGTAPWERGEQPTST